MDERSDEAHGIHRRVREYYGRTLDGSSDLQTNACCVTEPPPSWLARLLDNVHEEVQHRFYGCGLPIPEVLEGATVVDLGCGSGRDVYLLSQLVGPRGMVHGVDMRPFECAETMAARQLRAGSAGGTGAARESRGSGGTQEPGASGGCC